VTRTPLSPQSTDHTVPSGNGSRPDSQSPSEQASSEQASSDPSSDPFSGERPPNERDERALTLLEAARTADEDERHDLLKEVNLTYTEVARSVASRYRGRGIASDDLRQAAYEGLVKAVHRFDPERRADFLSFAIPTIRGEVQRHFRDHGWVVRPPRRLQELQWRSHRATDELAQELGREPDSGELAEELGMTSEELGDAMQAYGSFRPTSLDQPVPETGAGTIGELIPGDDPDARAAEARMVVAPLVRRLDERDRRILYLRFCEERTQQEIGDDIGVTQMQVSRILIELRSEVEAA
jgi:RNA polymerase sigma-B factor